MVGKFMKRLHSWGFVLVSRIVGTTPATDQKTKGIRNEINRGLMMRAELNALVSVLIKEGKLDEARYNQQVELEAKLLCDAYAKEFPGFDVADNGEIKIDPVKVIETMRGWPQ